MSNLIEQYGVEWFSSKFNGSFFMHEDAPHIVTTGQRNWRTQVPCLRLTKTGDVVERTSMAVPSNVFTDVGMFSVPNLGWRAAHNGKYLAYYKRNNNSYHRGLSMRNMVCDESVVTRWLRSYANYDGMQSEHEKAYAAMMPEFLSITEGAEKIRREEIISFAVSPTIAVIPIENDKLAVLFKQKQAGTINADNSMTLLIPELSSYMENL